MRLHVHLVPALVEPEALSGATVVVIDVLRATTTITAALAAGAADILVCEEVEQALRTAQSFPPGAAVLGGERHGVLIPGFDLGNSPTEYTSATVGGKTVIFTTTNGARALVHARRAKQVLVSGFVNLSTVAAAIRDEPQVDILCAGTQGQVGYDDALVAGALVERWTSTAPASATLNDQTHLTLAAWRHVAGIIACDSTAEVDAARLAAALRESQAGRNLIALSMTADIEAACRIDSIPLLPRFDPLSSRVTVSTTTC